VIYREKNMKLLCWMSTLPCVRTGMGKGFFSFGVALVTWKVQKSLGMEDFLCNFCLMIFLSWPTSRTGPPKRIVKSNLAIRNFLVTLKLFLNTKSSLSLWSKWQICHRKWFLNTNLFLIKPFLIGKFDCNSISWRNVVD
jgi:hypothetical protein